MWFPPINLYSLPKQLRDYERPMDIYCLDFETYYDKQFSLSKLTYDEYINDDRFEVIGVGIQRNNEPPQWFSGSKQDTYNWLSQFELHNHAVLMHNAMFDASILAFHFGICPKIILDTLAMARASHGTTVGNSLKRLAEYYEVGVKGEEVFNFVGYKRENFSKAELDSYAAYCMQDVNLTKQIFDLMKPEFKQSELKLIDMTIRMYTEPQFMYDRDFLTQHLEKVKRDRENIVSQIVRRIEFAEEGVFYPDDSLLDVMGPATEQQRLTALENLRSNPKFARLLQLFGETPPMKISPTTGKPTFALAKTDEGMKQLLEHPRPIIQALAAARLGVKSSLEETRTQRLIDTGDRNCGYLPIGLNYYGARTGRWSACVVADTQLTVYDVQKGVIEKRIVDVLLDDLIWDGEAFVQHEGVVFNGYAEVISWDGITGTEDHVVFTEDGERSLHSAMQAQCRIKVAGAITEDAVDAARKLSCIYKK